MPYRCPDPECDSTAFSVEATEYTTAYIDKVGDCYDSTGGDIEWGDDSEMKCQECGHTAATSAFWCDDEDC